MEPPDNVSNPPMPIVNTPSGSSKLPLVIKLAWAWLMTIVPTKILKTEFNVVTRPVQQVC